MKKAIPILILLITSIGFSQVTNLGEPLSWNYTKNQESITPQILPTINMKALKEEDKKNDLNTTTPWRFGFMHTVDYGFEDGQWTYLENGDRIWRIHISSPGALSLNVIFDEYFLPEGATVYLYNTNRTDVQGAYTATQNQESGILATWLVKGDSLWIEYYEPAQVANQGRLHIAKVTHGYRNAESYYNVQGLNNSGPCNLDVNCPIGADWQAYKDINKQAVAMLITGSSICTGALINNSANDGTPYFLTSNSCYSDPASWIFRFGWISPNPICAQDEDSTDSPDEFIISGATLRARNETSDFCLVEINNELPTEWNTVLAGWNKTDNTPNFQVGIHHPTADIMKVCRDDDPATKELINSVQTWEITGGAYGGWELGTTEGGSLGSPLFDQDGKIIGQLTGGEATCNGINDNGQNNFYGRFGISWNTGDTPETRLRDWLDPEGLNPDFINSYPPQETYALDGGIMASFNGINCANSEVAPIITFTNYGTDPITEANLEWRLNNGGNNTINFNGNLVQYESEEYNIDPLFPPTGTNEFYVTITSVNGVADQNTENNDFIDSIETIELDSYDTIQIYLELQTDDYAEETSWEFIDTNGTILYNHGPYEDGEDNTVFNYTFTVNYDQCYSFIIYDTYGDGICCGYGNGYYILTTDDDTIIATGGEFENEDIIENISVDEPLNISENLFQNISIYPNPANEVLFITTSEVSSEYKYQILNIFGQIISQGSLTNANTTIFINDYSSGVYFIKVIDSKTNQVKLSKIIIE